MGLVCLNNTPGIGETCAQSSPLTVLSGLFLTSPDFQFDTFADFATESVWKAGIANGDIFPVQNIDEDEIQNVEDAIYESPTGNKGFQYEGRRGHMFKVRLPLEQHKKLRQYSHGNWRAFYLDYSNNMRGTTPDGTIVKGFRLSFFYIPKQQLPSADGPAFSLIQLQERSIDEWDKNGIYVNPTWLGSDLQGVLDVLQTPGSVSSNSVTVSVAYIDDSELTAAGAAKSTPVSGLVAANFKILNGTTEVTTGKTVTETAVAGTYTVAATTLVAGYKLQVIPSATMLYRSEQDTLA